MPPIIDKLETSTAHMRGQLRFLDCGLIRILIFNLQGGIVVHNVLACPVIRVQELIMYVSRKLQTRMSLCNIPLETNSYILYLKVEIL